jgi:phosphoglycerate-specific signal transduction histidine kinase
MDKQVFEIMGNILLQAAKSQEQYEKFSGWLKNVFQVSEKETKNDTDELMSALKKIYSMGSVKNKDEPPIPDVLDQLGQNFQQSIDTFMDMMSCVPRHKHIELIEKYENLKKTCEEKDETIKNLRLLLSEKTAGVSDTVNELHDIIQKQTEQFMHFMQPFTKS